MLLIKPRPTFWSPVELSVLGEDNPMTVEMEFRYRSRTQLQELFRDAEGKSDETMIHDYIVAGWRGLETPGEDGQPVPLPYTPENVAMLADTYPAAAMEIMMAYRLALTTARQKN